LNNPSRPKRTLRQRLLFVALPVLIATVLLVIGIPMALGAMFMRGITGGGCGGVTSPDEYDLPFEEVLFYASAIDLDLHGFFIPGDNGVTLLVPPTGNAGNGNLMHEIAVLNRQGYTVMTWEARSCEGFPYHSLGYAEADDVRSALDYLAARGAVDAVRVGIHGFSTAGATAIIAGARYPELRTVLAEGNYHDFPEHLSNSLGGWYGAFYLLGARITYRLNTGLEMSNLSPVSVIGQIAPRPIMLIYGQFESALYGGHLELAAAGPNAQLWEVPGAQHGNYWHVAPEEFERRVIAFYNTAWGLTS
jgi:uncharacterized protein